MSSHLAGMREDRAPSWSAFAARRASGSCPLVGCRRRRERQRPEDCRAATTQLRSFGGSGRLLARRARTRWPPWEVVLTPGPFAAGFANGIPALDNPTLVCRRRIPPIRLLSFGELAFGDLNQLVIGLHDRIVRMRHFEAAMTLGTERAHVKPGFRQESHRGVDAMMGHQTASASVHRPAHRGQNTCSSRRALMSCSCLDRSPNTTLGPGPHRGQPRVRMQRVSHPAAAPADTGAENRLRRNRIFSWRPDRLGDGLGLDWRRVLRGQRLVRRIGEHRWLRLFLGRRIVGHNPRLRTHRHLLRRRLTRTIGRSDRRRRPSQSFHAWSLPAHRDRELHRHWGPCSRFTPRLPRRRRWPSIPAAQEIEEAQAETARRIDRTVGAIARGAVSETEVLAVAELPQIAVLETIVRVARKRDDCAGLVAARALLVTAHAEP